MHRNNLFPALLALLLLANVHGDSLAGQKKNKSNRSAGTLQFEDICDASGAALHAGGILVAGDEDSILRGYSLDGGKPRARADLALLLNRQADEEMDLEGMAAQGSMLWLIGSHGRDSKGRPSSARRLLFAVEVKGDFDDLQVALAGRPFEHLAEQLAADERYRALGLDKDIGDLEQDDALLAPKKNGFNVEGLALNSKGDLLIGVRNPRPKQQALLITVMNPRSLLEGAEQAQLGDPILLDLQGNGVRSLDLSADGQAFVLISGASTIGGDFQALLWTPKTGEIAEVARFENDSLRAEAVVATDRSTLLVLEDAGSRIIDGEECKKLPKKERFFSGLLVAY